VKDVGVMSIIEGDYFNRKVVIRKVDYSDLIYVFDEGSGDLISRNIRYNVQYKDEVVGEFEYNSKIGGLDIETYRIEEGNDVGLSVPYSCGYISKKGVNTFYRQDDEEGVDLIRRMLNRLVSRENDKTIFYAHNLAGFDSRFILSALEGLPNFKRSIMGRDMNEIFYIKITRVVKGKHISVILMDSMYYLTASLEKLGNSFKVKTRKGYFPHSFMNSGRLNYIGKVPDYI
jgi:hypothetical protein